MKSIIKLLYVIILFQAFAFCTKNEHAEILEDFAADSIETPSINLSTWNSPPIWIDNMKIDHESYLETIDADSLIINGIPLNFIISIFDSLEMIRNTNDQLAKDSLFSIKSEKIGKMVFKKNKLQAYYFRLSQNDSVRFLDKSLYNYHIDNFRNKFEGSFKVRQIYDMGFRSEIDNQNDSIYDATALKLNGFKGKLIFHWLNGYVRGIDYHSDI